MLTNDETGQGAVVGDDFEFDGDFAFVTLKEVEPLPAPSLENTSPGGGSKDFRKKFKPVKHLEARINAHVKAYVERLIASAGSEYAGLSVRVPPATVRPKGMPGASNVLRGLVDRILTSIGAAENQTELRKALQAQFPEHSVYKDWTKPLPDWAVKYAQEQAFKSVAPFSTLSIKAPITLSQLHRAAKASVAFASGEQEYEATITLTGDRVFINGEHFSITDNRSGGRTYRTARVRIERLLEALSK